MKNLRTLLIVLFANLTLIACSSDGDGGGGGSAAEGTITAKIDGSNFQSNTDFTMAHKVNAGAGTTVTLQGSDNSGKALVFVVNGFEGVGVYNIGGDASISITASYVEPNVSNPAASGTWQAPFNDTVAGEIEFTESSDTKVVGTFSFMAKSSSDDSTKEFTDGSFNLTFQ